MSRQRVFFISAALFFSHGVFSAERVLHAGGAKRVAAGQPPQQVCYPEYLNCDVRLRAAPLVLEVRAAPGPIDNREENLAWLKALNVNVNLGGAGSGKAEPTQGK